MLSRTAISCVLVFSLVLATSTASASSGTGISWNFQATGHDTSIPITALAMRDGLTWPVIFAGDFDTQTVKAISLYPVLNTQTFPPTLWHEIGNNLMPSINRNTSLRAASSPAGEFAAVSSMPFPDPGFSYAVTGSSLSGFASVGDSIYGIDYDLDGNLVTLTPDTLPLPTGHYPMDIDSSIPGTIGVISYDGLDLSYHQTSPLLGGWFSSELLPDSHTPDLALDTLGRPHVSAFVYTGNGGIHDLVVNDFDIMTGGWTTTTLDTLNVNPGEAAATMAADSLGGVGVAWVSEVGVLKYGYKNGNDPWATHVVTTGVGGEAIALLQKPGLAFDANDFPVISFTTDGVSSKNIWLAYDPPASVPEPSTVLLLVSGLLVVAFFRKRIV